MTDLYLFLFKSGAPTGHTNRWARSVMWAVSMGA